MTRDLLTVAAAAERLALHPSTVRRLIADGELTPIRLGKAAVRLDPNDIEAYVDRCREPSKATA